MFECWVTVCLKPLHEQTQRQIFEIVPVDLFEIGVDQFVDDQSIVINCLLDCVLPDGGWLQRVWNETDFLDGGIIKSRDFIFVCVKWEQNPVGMAYIQIHLQLFFEFFFNFVPWLSCLYI